MATRRHKRCEGKLTTNEPAFASTFADLFSAGAKLRKVEAMVDKLQSRRIHTVRGKFLNIDYLARNEERFMGLFQQPTVPIY